MEHLVKVEVDPQTLLSDEELDRIGGMLGANAVSILQESESLLTITVSENTPDLPSSCVAGWNRVRLVMDHTRIYRFRILSIEAREAPADGDKAL